MASSSTRRSPSRGRAAGAGLLAPERPAPRVIEHESFSLQGEPRPPLPGLSTGAFTGPEEDPREEVTIEPDLPTEQAEPAPVDPEPVDPARAQYEARVAAMDPAEPVYVAGNRAPRLKMGEYTLAPGDVVPGAHSWPRREAYERLGRIERR